MPDIAQQVLAAAESGSPLGQAIVSYLRARQALPEIVKGYLPRGTDGEFSTNTTMGSELPKNGLITVSSAWNPASGGRTAVHELAHAADRELANQYFQIPRGSRRSNQYAQAFDKLVVGLGDKQSPRNRLAQALGGEKFAKEREDYRASSSELAAFGAGSTVNPNDLNPAPLHVDATNATELAILLELAQRKKVK